MHSKILLEYHSIKFNNVYFKNFNRKAKFVKKGLILLACLFAAIANLPLHYLAYRMFYVEPLLENTLPPFRPIIDYEPFPKTWYWTSTIVVWCITAFAVMLLFLKRPRGKAGVSVLALVFLRKNEENTVISPTGGIPRKFSL